MKKALIFILMLSMLLGLTACGASPAVPAAETTPMPTVPTTPAQEIIQAETPEPSPETKESKSIIVYFSWSGNTESVAYAIQERTGADIFKLDPVEAYTDNYNTLLDVAKEEQRSAARPAILGIIDFFDGYDTVYVGFPNWWGDMPMILYSFFDDYDLSGKTIVPFVTSGGSGFSNTISKIAELEPEATVLDGLSLGSSAAAQPADEVSAWLAGLEG